MAHLDDHLIDPPDKFAGGEIVDCHVCDGEIELPAEECPRCHTPVAEDNMRDQLEAAAEPPEWG